MTQARQAELFKILGVESRIQIIELLKAHGPLGVNELSERLGITPSAVSQHLKTLRYAGLVRSERKGYWIPYEIDPAALAKCNELLGRVCACGCKAADRSRDQAPLSDEGRLAQLREREAELRQALEEVQARIDRIKS